MGLVFATLGYTKRAEPFLLFGEIWVITSQLRLTYSKMCGKMTPACREQAQAYIFPWGALVIKKHFVKLIY